MVLEENHVTLFDETTMPNDNIILYAKWNPLNVKYYIEHYVENADDDNYSLMQKAEKEGLAGTSVVATPLNLIWISENITHIDRVTNGEIKGDGSLVLKLYYTRNTYTITVNGDGGIDKDGNDEVSIVAKYEATITPPNFTRKGYRFVKWSITFPEKMPYTNLSISAKWEEVYVKYKVEHYQENANDNNYTLIETQTFTELIDHEVIAELKNYLGFSVNSLHADSKHEGITLDNNQLVLKVFYKRNIYTITFKDDKGNPLSITPIEVKYGAPIQEPEDPSKVGYTFIGWYISLDATERFDFTTMPVGGATLYARFEAKLYTITFVSNADISVTEIKAEYNTPIQEPSVPIRQGYTFLGWYSDEECTTLYEFTVMPAKDITLYAKWEPNEVTLTFVYNDGRSNSVITGNVGESLEPIIPERIGYTFDAWYLDLSFNTKFDEWKMPVISTTLYAYWIPIDYTINFISGFDDVVIEPLEAPYDSWIDLPIPEKAGYEFAGWYLDAEKTIPFEIDTMPLDGATLYAKWIEETQQTSIAYALSRNRGTLVTIKGIVYAKLESPYKGFYIQDANNQIYCFANQDLVNIGDEVYITGHFEQWNQVPMINGVTNISVNSTGNNVLTPTSLNLDDLEFINPDDDTFGKHIQMSGIIIHEDGQLYLVDPITYIKIPITHQSYNRFELLVEPNKKYSGEFVLSGFEDNWQIAIVGDTLVEIPLTNQEKIDLVKSNLLNLTNKTYFPLSTLKLPSEDIFGWTVISSNVKLEDTLYYDTATGLLADSIVPYQVDFDVLISMNGLKESFTLTIRVEPYQITTIYDYLVNYVEGETYYIRGTIIRSVFSEVVIQDATGTLLLYQDIDANLLELGEEVIILITERSYYNSYFKVVKLISTKNTLPEAVKLTKEELNNRIEDSNSIRQYEYVELRGIFTMNYDDYFGEYYLTIDGIQLTIIDMTNSLNTLFPFNNMEVIIRGYLYYEYGNWFLVFDNNRHDFQIPKYSDLELVSTIQQLIINKYQNIEFYSYDYFSIPACHPILGGNISWKMAKGYETYYDIETGRFNNVDVPTQIAIDISISFNEVNISFTMNKTLYPDNVTLANELSSIDDGETVIIKGTVIYRHFNYFYLQDETGIIYVVAYGNYVCKGDYIRISAEKYTVSLMPQLDWDQFKHSLDIISTNNPVTIQVDESSVSGLKEFDPEGEIPITSYIELTGLLKVESGFRLYYGQDFVIIETIDGYTDYELKLYDNHLVKIKCYLYDYDYYYQTWKLMFTGLDHEIASTDYTNVEKIDFVKSYLESSYQQSYQSDMTHNLLHEYPLLGASISYRIIKDELNCFDINESYIHPVSENTTVELEATISVGENQEVVLLTMHVLKTITGSSLPVTIAEFKASNGETLTIVAKVIDIYDNAILVEDNTGMLLINQVYFPPYSYYNYVNRNYEFTGNLHNYRGRLEMNATDYKLISIGTETEVIYEKVELSEIVSYDHWDDTVFGKPVEITGTLKYEIRNYEFVYYLTDGFDKVRISNANYIPGGFIDDYVGLEISVKGRIYGLGKSIWGDDIWTIGAARYPVTIKDYTDEEIVDIIKDRIINEYDKATYQIFDTVYFTPSYSSFPYACFSFEVTRGNEFIDFDGNFGSFYWTETDQEIDFLVTITNGTVTKTFTITINIEGIELSNIDDIFLNVEGTTKLYLRGTLLYVTYDGAYFLIDNQVYFLANVYTNKYEHRVDREYLISGYRAQFDGETNLRYYLRIEEWLDDYHDEYPEPESLTIQEIYQEDLHDLQRKIIHVSGTLRYEQCSDSYYLENLGEKVYLRVMHPEIGFTSDYSVLNGYMPEWLIDEEVIVRCLFPNKTVKGKYLLDVYGDVYDAIFEIEYSPAERVERVKYDLQKYYHLNEFYSFDSIWFDKYLRDCDLTWELVYQDDEQYFYKHEYGESFVTWISEPKTITYQVTITYDDGEMDPIIATTIVEIILKPRNIITIQELLHQPTNEYYVIKGIIQEVNQEDDGWLLLKDETGMIIVQTYGEYFDGLSFEIGDEVIIYGSFRYDRSHTKPMIDFAKEVIILSRGNPVSTPSPTVLSVEEVFALDYLDPSIVGMYITTTGEIVRKGYSWYGYTYYIVDGENEIQIMSVITETDNYENLLDDLLGKGRISISGYLHGLSSSYNHSDWYMTFSGIYYIQTS